MDSDQFLVNCLDYSDLSIYDQVYIFSGDSYFFNIVV
jgi:hypothetical protein